ncbi:hypothetical protein Hanom_Chr03g00214501 [Helianthus anomalus]
MDDMFMNPFSDMYAFVGNSGGDDTSSIHNNENTSSTKISYSDTLGMESVFGTHNKPPRLMAIVE